MSITASQLTAAMYLQKAMFADSAKKADYVAETNIAKALIENTTAKLVPIVSSPDKKQSMKIYWNKFCDNTTSTSDPDFCSFSGTEPDSDSDTYTIQQQVSGTFTIDEAKYETNLLNVEEVFADLMLKTKKNLDEKISKVLVSSLGAMVSPNLLEDSPGCPGVASPADWTTTYIPPGNWTPELMYYFMKVIRKNKFTSPFLLDGKNLGFKMWEAMMNAGNANGSGAANMMKLLKYYEDFINIEDIDPGKTFMVDRGTTAFANRALWGKYSASNPKMEPEVSRMKYSENSENLPGVVYDVYIKASCSGKFLKHDVLVHTQFDLFNGAKSCDDATGVLEFVCGACPS